MKKGLRVFMWNQVRKILLLKLDFKDNFGVVM